MNPTKCQECATLNSLGECPLGKSVFVRGSNELRYMIDVATCGFDRRKNRRFKSNERPSRFGPWREIIPAGKVVGIVGQTRLDRQIGEI